MALDFSAFPMTREPGMKKLGHEEHKPSLPPPTPIHLVLNDALVVPQCTNVLVMPGHRGLKLRSLTPRKPHAFTNSAIVTASQSLSTRK